MNIKVLNIIKIIKNYILMIFNYLKCFKMCKTYLIISLAVIMSGCATHNSLKKSSKYPQKWEDYFDSKEFRSINENNQSIEIKQNLKKVM